MAGARNHSILLIALFAGVAASLLSLFFNDNLGNDAAFFYSRMAQQFIEGNYRAAFFHSIPPLSPVAAGILGKVGLNGWTAMKLLSGLCFVAAIYWVYLLCRHIISERQAQWAALLYVFCPRLIRYGVAGQLEAAKMFLLLFTFERAIIFVKTRRTGTLFQASVGASLLILARNEGIMYFPFLLLLVFLSDWTSDSSRSTLKKVINRGSRCLLPISTALLICSPWLVYQYQQTGYAVIGSRQYTVLSRKFHQPEKQEIVSSHKTVSERPVVNRDAKRDGDRSLYQGRQALKETIRGLYPPYFIPLLPAIFFLFKSRRWKPEYGWFLGLLAYQVIVDWAVRPQVMARFIIPAIPFYFPALIAGWAPLLQRKASLFQGRRRIYGIIFLILLCATAFSKGLSDVRKTVRGESRAEKRLGLWIREHASEFDTLPAAKPESRQGHRDYRTGADLVVASAVPQIAFWAGADMVFAPWRQRHLKIGQVLKNAGVDLMIADDKFSSKFPEFMSDPSPYRQIELPWEEGAFTLFLYGED